MADNLLIYNGKAAKIKSISEDLTNAVLEATTTGELSVYDLHEAWKDDDKLIIRRNGKDVELYISVMDIEAPEGKEPVLVYLTLDSKIPIARKLVERLKSLPDDEGQWIGYYDTFNKWEFPVEFYDLIPMGWTAELSREAMKKKSEIIHDVMEVVKNKYGDKEILRRHNVNHHHSMTNEEFEHWYSLSSDKQTEYHERRMYIERIHWWKDEVFKKIKSLNIGDNTPA
ncbi:MAG TPA: hypothetical protein PKL22_10600 [Saprospiraceae bacterium]|nr:hypothetical protein [Saprospiraceae bacterium]HNT22610.1 hypothetical protein [Saprospiraceae bacterium]